MATIMVMIDEGDGGERTRTKWGGNSMGGGVGC